MLGRVIYHNPFLLTEVNTSIFRSKDNEISRENILLDYINYINTQLKIGVPMRSMTRHILGLYHGESNAKLFRRLLSGKSVEMCHLKEWLDFKKNTITSNESDE